MRKTELLVLVPHEDDELAIAGAALYGAVRRGMQVKVVFATNGDFFLHEGPIRIREAKRALNVLGIKEEDIIFLGYGDQTKTKHLYNSAPDEAVPSYNGNCKTYGTPETPEFAWTEYGTHHAYTRENYKNDIKAVIEKYRPETIITTDWDNHMDHLALSLMLDEVMGELLKENGSYCPLILKAQAYTGKWEGRADYYENRNMTEHVNLADGTEHVHPLNRWEDRIRFSVPSECKTALLRDNILYKAAKEYRSQSVDLKAPQFINRDMVYWRRPTQSLSYRADITVSSGESRFLNDFKCADCSDIVNGMWNYDSGVWVPNEDDTEKKITITLENPSKIKEIHFFENPSEGNCIFDMKILFSPGGQMHTGELAHDGSRTVIKVPDMEAVEKITVFLEKTKGDAAGLTEVEIYDRALPVDPYRFPLPLWEDGKEESSGQKKTFTAAWEKKWFQFITYGRVRLWPDKYFLMKRYPDLKETDNAFVFCKAYLRFVLEKLKEKI